MVVNEVYSSNWYFVFLVEQGKTWAQILKGACVTNFFFFLKLQVMVHYVFNKLFMLHFY